jgi:D-glycero-alpha-D-manno-heptose-7-phosphate kinase
MIICKTPFRISLFGGGTDFPKYYLNNGGCVIGGTIDKYSYVTARFLPTIFKYKHKIVWSKTETVNSINEIYNPPVRVIFKKLKIQKGLEIHYQGDLQKNSGLGTSSSFCVGLINAITNLYNKKISTKKLALEATYIEQKMLKENCGSQDQIFASYGGFNFINFKKDGNFKVNKLVISDTNFSKLNNNMLLIYTGIHRFSNNVEKDKILNLDKNIKTLDQIKEMTLSFKKILNNNSIDIVGEMLDEYWHLKKSLSKKVTNDRIDEIYKLALKSGASGGKIIGSGGGGFILVYCKKKFQSNLIKNLNKLPIVKFKFVNEGSKILSKT